jgi:hypothetical protein
VKSLTPDPSPKGEGSSIRDLKDLIGFLNLQLGVAKPET